MKSANKKNSGGNQMSLLKSATRRMSLLAGSSLVVASVSAATTAGVLLAPVTAFAQATCTAATTVTGNGTNTVTIAGGTSNPGVTCNYVGDSATVSTLGSLTVSTSGGVPGDPLVNGVNLRATGTSDIVWTSTAGTVTGGAQTNGPVIDAQTASGDITINAAGVSGTAATITRAIRAEATGAGAVTVNTTGNISATNLAAGNTIAIEALSGGGDVTVNHTVSSFSAISGRLYGVYARTSGAGDVDITVMRENSSQTVSASSSLAGGAGIYAETGTGTVTISGRGDGGAGTGVLINSSGDINFTGSGSGNYGVDILNVASGRTATVNLTSGTTGTLAAVRAAGAGEVLLNISGLQGAMNFDFTGMSAPVDVNFVAGGAWRPTPNVSTVIPDGNFLINIESGAALIAGEESSSLNAEPATILTFSDPDMVLTNAGFIIVGPDRADTSHQYERHEAELRIIGLNEFHHSGTILLGGAGYPGVSDGAIQGFKTADTDSWYDDMLVFENGGWIGEGGRVVFDVDTNQTQTNCVREAVTNDFAAADCLRIVNSTVEGTTYLSINQTFAGDRGRLTQQIMDQGIVLVETPGTTVAAENFALDPSMKGYNPDAQSLDKGLYQYVLLFDEEAEQFKLFGTLSGAAYQLPVAATAAHNLWRLSTGSWLDRQADLRGATGPGIGGGVWMRASGDRTRRDIVSVSTLGGLPFSTDNSYEADTYAVTGGVDLVTAAGENMAYVVGLMAGYGHTDIGYESSRNTQAMDAWIGGVYGSFIAGGLFIDAVVNANHVIVDSDAPGFDLLPEGTILSSRMFSVGGQVEAGWRFGLGNGLFAEPLASVSYVRSKMDDLQINPDDFSRPGLEVSYDDPSSLRAGVGGRLGLDTGYAGMRTQVSLLGKLWNDLEGRNTAVVHNLAFPNDPDLRIVDDFSGMFSELAVGANLWSPGGAVSGFLNLGGKFSDDYDAQNLSAGVRVNW